MKKLNFLVLFLTVCSMNLWAQSEPWISYPSANNTIYGVYHFRKTFRLDKVPEKFIIHVSADNRYNLFVNGKRICYGPAKGDLQTYKYDIVDIAPFLEKGENCIASLVYNGGKDKPLAFLSVQTAFMLRAEDPQFNWISTDNSWKVYKDEAYKVISYQELIFEKRWYYGFYACGGGDDVNASIYPWGWEESGFDDSHWQQAEKLFFEGNPPWNLVPRNIPFMDNFTEYPAKIRLSEGIALEPGNWKGDKELTVPAKTKAKILIDFEFFTMGYPELKVSGGAGSKIQVKYAEALYKEVHLKAHRDSVNNLNMFGVWDIFRPDGETRTFRPLWKRAFRYVQFVIETQDEPLKIRSYRNEYSGYPYREMATFESNDERLNELFEMCSRTLRMCSGETYYDTPFYEQLSYGGDNLPITTLSTYMSNDDRLLREMLRLYSQSENKETGLLKSAYPSRFDFDHGTFSLAWIQTLHDYYKVRGDLEFIRPFTEKIERILDFFKHHIDENTGLIGTVTNRNFADWSITKGRLPRSNEEGELVQSALLTLYFAHTIDCATRLFNELGLPENALEWDALNKKIKEGVYKNCWDEEEKLFRDIPGKKIFSQHTNVLAIFCDLIPVEEQKEMLNRILSFDGFDEMASSYFSFFLFKAMQKTGQEDLFLENLAFWYNFMDYGHTTCGETGFASHDRSDCHAWSAHPAYYLLSSVCGIKPAKIGFNEVIIAPHLGNLQSVNASMPHRKGRIKVEYRLNNGKLTANVVLPKGIKGNFLYNGQQFVLNEGKNNISCR